MMLKLPRTLHKQDDQTLLQKVRKGNERAFKALYYRHWKTVFAFVYNRLQDRPGSEEIVEELFIELWDQRHTIPVVTSLSDHLRKTVKPKLLEKITVTTMVKDNDTLLKQTAKGSEEAFQALFDKFRPNIYTVSNKLLRSEEKARDVVYQVFNRAWKDRKSLKHIRDARRYFFDEAIAEMLKALKTNS